MNDQPLVLQVDLPLAFLGFGLEASRGILRMPEREILRDCLYPKRSTEVLDVSKEEALHLKDEDDERRLQIQIRLRGDYKMHLVHFEAPSHHRSTGG